MKITEVRIKLMEDPNDRLQAFCSITFDSAFVIRDLKIIQGGKGPFVAMPSRKLTDRCPRCGGKNDLRARHCCDCGARLDDERAIRDETGRARLYADIAHPINSQCRDMIQRHVLEAFELEQIRSKEPGYVCRYDDYGEDRFAALASDEHMEPVMLQSSNATSHRLESAAEPARGPHRTETATHRHHVTTVDPRNSATDDAFGTGLE